MKKVKLIIKKHRIFYFILIIALTVCVFACCYVKESKKGYIGYKCNNCNVILISVDTLRADRLGIYGYQHNTSPNIDRFSERAFIFKNHISQAPWTIPSHASLFTSLYPAPFGLSQNERFGSDPVIIQEILQKNNYTTVAFTDGIFMTRDFGFDRGFDFFDDTGGGLSSIIPKVTSWVANNNNKKPFFLFIHTYDTHCLSDLKPPQPYRDLYKQDNEENLSLYCSHLLDLNNLSRKEIETLNRVYDGSVNYMDSQLGLLFDFIDAKGLSKNTIFLLTSDHGEEFGDHGLFDHAHSLYEEAIHVPLIIRLPTGSPGKVIDSVTSNVDIFPTVLDFLDITYPGNIEGVSLSPIMFKNKKTEKAYSIRSEKDSLEERLISIKEQGFIVSILRVYKKMEHRESPMYIPVVYNLSDINKENGHFVEFLKYLSCGENNYSLVAIVNLETYDHKKKELDMFVESIRCNDSSDVGRYKIDNLSFNYDKDDKIVYDHSYCIRSSKWKLILSKNNPPELFDLEKDPEEKNNLIDKEPEIANKLKNELEGFLEEKKLAPLTTEEEVDKEMLEKLSSLGYIN